MTLFNPIALFFLISLPAVVLMYILKQRSTDHTVSSLFLWREALRDVQASSPWQKLRKNLLLFLQLLILIFAVFALSRPFLHQKGVNVKEAILVIDTSVSMQSVDVKPSRFDTARQEMIKYIENMLPGSRAALISAGSTTHIAENMSADRVTLLNKLGNLKVSNGSLNFDEMNEVLKVMSRQYPEAEVIVYTDNPVKGIDANIKWVNIGRETQNYAVTLLSHAINQNKITALSGISNFGKDTAKLSVSLYADDRMVDAKDIEVKAGSTENVYWYSIPEGTHILKCVIENEDMLAVDNTAWDVINYGTTGKALLVTERNVFLERVLAVQPGIELYKTTPGAAAGQAGYSLYIYDGFLPQDIPGDGNLIVINPPEGNSLLNVSGEAEAGHVNQIKDPIFDNINKIDFSVSKIKKMSLPVWSQEVLYSGEFPLLIKGEKGTQRFVIFGFDLHNSDLPLKTSFPVLMNNVVTYLLPQHIENINAVQPGASIDFNLLPGITSARVISPGGTSTDIVPPFPAKTYDNTGETGVYTLEQKTGAESSVHYFAVNIPSKLEFQAANQNISQDINHNQNVNRNIIQNQGLTQGQSFGVSQRLSQRLSLQWIFILIAFLIVLAEWWVWSKDI